MSHVLNSELLTAVLAAKKAIAPIKRSATNPFFKSKYATLDAVLEAVEDILFNNSLFLSQAVEGNTLVTHLYHTNGGYLEATYPLQSDLDAQKFGSAITYARRYSIGALLCLSLEDDDDGNAASKPQEVAPKAQQVKAKSTIF